MRRLAPLAMLAVMLLSACGGTDRPEGVVERWLISLNQGKAGRPGTYAAQSTSRRILPHWQDRDPGDLDVIEVGKGRATAHRALVPFRVERTSGLKISGVAELRKPRGDWRVVGVSTERAGLLVPSEGGPRIGSAPAGWWLVAIGLSVVLILLVAVALSLTPKPLTLPTRRTG